MELYPDRIENGEPLFKFSLGWFNKLKARNHLSLRRITNKAQTVPDSKIEDIRSFHLFIRREAAKGSSVGPLGKWALNNIANIDQTPLEFDVFAKGSTYDATGSTTIWVKTCGSGLDKRQATVHLTIFADGIRRIKPLIIFKGKGTRISNEEKRDWDKGVVVRFQENAWADEEVMMYYFRHMWSPWMTKAGNPSKLLIADVHRAQKTDKILRFLRESCNTTMALVPPGCTSLIQPLDVSVNAPFKNVSISCLSSFYQSRASCNVTISFL
jgi:hypothetical protein